MLKKSIFIFLLFISCREKAVAQTGIKILFDASKAETAGNADWVIDADLHNIGYTNGPAVVGQGNESNPQRIPTPAQSGITQSTAETFWNGALSAWGVDCVKQGYIVETLPYNGTITYGNSSNAQDLSHYKVFIICEPNIVFTAAEKTALLNFVQNGGGLFMISDHDQSDRNNDGWDSPAIWNDFMTNNSMGSDPFGISVDLQNFSETSTNVANLPGDSILHGPMGNVSEVQWSNGTSFTLHPNDNPTVKGVIYKTSSANSGNSNVLCAYARYGSGKVAIIGDSSPCDDGTGDPNDALYNGYFADANGNHQLLLINITIWLAETGSVTTGVNTVANENSFSVFPNPCNGFAQVNFNTTQLPSTLSVFSAAGKMILEEQVFPGQQIDLSVFSDGVYFAILNSGGMRSAQRLVIAR